jgi:hypothetical protein
MAPSLFQRLDNSQMRRKPRLVQGSHNFYGSMQKDACKRAPISSSDGGEKNPKPSAKNT